MANPLHCPFFVAVASREAARHAIPNRPLPAQAIAAADCPVSGSFAATASLTNLLSPMSLSCA